MSLANKDSFTFSILIWMLFNSFSCQIALARTSNTMLIRSDNSKTSLSFLFPILRESIQSFTIVILAVGFLYMPFITLKISSISVSLCIFIMKEPWVFVKCFSESIEMITWSLSLIKKNTQILNTLLIEYITLLDFYVELILHFWDKST